MNSFLSKKIMLSLVMAGACSVSSMAFAADAGPAAPAPEKQQITNGGVINVEKGKTVTLDNTKDTAGSTINVSGDLFINGVYDDSAAGTKSFTVNAGGKVAGGTLNLGTPQSDVQINGGVKLGKLVMNGKTITVGTEAVGSTPAVAGLLSFGDASEFKPTKFVVQGNSQADIDDFPTNDAILYQIKRGGIGINGGAASAAPAAHKVSIKPLSAIDGTMKVLNMLCDDVVQHNPTFANVVAQAFINKNELDNINNGAAMGLSMGPTAADPVPNTWTLGNNSAVMLVVDPVLNPTTHKPDVLTSDQKNALKGTDASVQVQNLTFAKETKPGANDQPGVALEAYYAGTYAIFANAQDAALPDGTVDPTKVRFGNLNMLLEATPNTATDKTHSYVNANGVLIQDYNFIDLDKHLGGDLLTPEAYQAALNNDNGTWYNNVYLLGRKKPGIPNAKEPANYPIYQFVYDVINKTGLSAGGQSDILNATSTLPAQAGMSHSTLAAMNTLTDAVADHHVGESNFVWATYTGSNTTVDRTNVTNVYSKGKLKNHGLVIGADLSRNARRASGVAVAFGKTTFSNSTHTDTGSDFVAENSGKYTGVALYSRYKLGSDSELKTDLSYMHASNDASLDFAANAAVQGFFRSKTDNINSVGSASTNVYSVGMTFEKKIPAGASSYMNPYVGLRYSHMGGYSFTSNQGLGYQVDGQSTLYVPVGVRYMSSHQSGAWTVRPMVEIGGVFATNTKAKVHVGSTNSYEYTDLDSASWLGKLAVNFEKTNTSYGLSYQYRNGKYVKGSDWQVMANFKF